MLAESEEDSSFKIMDDQGSEILNEQNYDQINNEDLDLDKETEFKVHHQTEDNTTTYQRTFTEYSKQTTQMQRANDDFDPFEGASVISVEVDRKETIMTKPQSNHESVLEAVQEEQKEGEPEPKRVEEDPSPAPRIVQLDSEDSRSQGTDAINDLFAKEHNLDQQFLMHQKTINSQEGFKRNQTMQIRKSRVLEDKIEIDDSVMDAYQPSIPPNDIDESQIESQAPDDTQSVATTLTSVIDEAFDPQELRAFISAEAAKHIRK